MSHFIWSETSPCLKINCCYQHQSFITALSWKSRRLSNSLIWEGCKVSLICVSRKKPWITYLMWYWVETVWLVAFHSRLIGEYIFGNWKTSKKLIWKDSVKSSHMWYIETHIRVNYYKLCYGEDLNATHPSPHCAVTGFFKRNFFFNPLIKLRDK